MIYAHKFCLRKMHTVDFLRKINSRPESRFKPRADGDGNKVGAWGMWFWVGNMGLGIREQSPEKEG